MKGGEGGEEGNTEEGGRRREGAYSAIQARCLFENNRANKSRKFCLHRTTNE
jgi:hypothetical protein